MVLAAYSDNFNNNTNIGPDGEFISKKNIFVGENGADYCVKTAKKVVLFDDFLGDIITDDWSAAVGNDGQTVIATVNAGGNGGTLRLTSGDTTVVAESLSSLTHGLNWKAGNGGLVFEARVTPVTSIANVSYFIGLSDVLATTTLEEPMTLSTATWTTTATDAVGFVYDTAGTVPGFYCMAVKNNTDATPIVNTVPVVATATVLRIEVDSTGAATFYRDGVLLGTIAAAVTSTVALTPIITVMARTTTSKSLDVDYVYTAEDRV